MDTNKVTRVEVIDHNGRSYVFDPRAHPDASIAVGVSLQDDGRTLKVYIDKTEKIRPAP